MKYFNCTYYQYNSISSTDTVLVNFMCTHWLNDDQNIDTHTQTHTHKKHRSNTTASESISLLFLHKFFQRLNFHEQNWYVKKKKLTLFFWLPKKITLCTEEVFFFFTRSCKYPYVPQKKPQLHFSGTCISIISNFLFPDGVLCRNSHIPFHSSVSHINPQDVG